MTNTDTIHGYFDCLGRKAGWENFLSEEIAFTSFTTPVERVTGKNAYLEATRQFFSTIVALEVKSLFVDGNRICALTRYRLQPPAGPVFDCHVAEVFKVREGTIDSLDIYFDSAPFNRQEASAIQNGTRS